MRASWCYGAAPALVQDVVLDGVRLELGRHTSWPGRRDLRPASNGGPHEVVVPGMYVERASGVEIRDSQVLWRGDRRDEYGSALVAVDAPELVVDGLRGRAARPGIPDMIR